MVHPNNEGSRQRRMAAFHKAVFVASDGDAASEDDVGDAENDNHRARVGHRLAAVVVAAVGRSDD